ncbi:MAG: EAL domain-containing protein [Thermoclostridium sp.]|nr:EAL domain-containing protein [Thermoclostridium sp.]
MSFLVIVYLLTSIFYVFIGTFSLMYDVKNKLNRVFFFFCLDLSLWSTILMLMNAASDAATATVFRRIATIFWSILYCLMLHFLLVLVEKDRLLSKPWFLGLFYLPAMISIYIYYIFTPVSSDLIVRVKQGWVYWNSGGNGILADFYLPLYYVTYILASIFLIRFWGKQSPMKRVKKQARILVVTIITVSILGSLTDIILPALGKPVVPALTVCFIVIPVYGIWYSIKRYRLMNLNPQNVVADVLKTMKEGMLITDRSHFIRDINEGARMMLGYSREELSGKPLELVVKNMPDFIDQPGTNELMLIRKDNQMLEVSFSSSTLLDEWNEPYGTVLIFQDLSENKRIQKELQASHDQLEQKVLERTRELNAANQDLKIEIDSRIGMEKEIRKLAYYDHLTGLSNKKRFIDSVNRVIAEKQTQDFSLAILYLDLDSFKIINDTMGHAQGDQLLKMVSQRLVSTVGNSDSIARVGGDEFLILVTGEADSIDAIASRLNETFYRQFNLSGNEVYVTTSIGVAIYPVDGEDAETLIKNADIAMYRAKDKGKNKYEVCTPAMKSSLVEIMNLTNQLYKAVSHREFELYYQPQVDISSGMIVGFEALIRWNHPELGKIAPEKFISIAEKTGLILPIGEWVLKNACQQMKHWHDQGFQRVPVAVNLSVRQFVDYDLVGMVAQALEETGLEPGYLELEITESILMEDTRSISETLQRLDDMGVKIAMDDFGMKYSSLNYLKQIPLHRLKIDMSFVQGITVNRKDEIIIDGIITLAKNLGIDVLAEGVETLEQLDFLKNSRCFIIQGYYLYEPMTADKIYGTLVKIA